MLCRNRCRILQVSTILLVVIFCIWKSLYSEHHKTQLFAAFSDRSLFEKKPHSELFSISREPNEAKEKVHHRFYRNFFNITNEPSVDIGPDNKTNGDKYLIYRCDENTLRRCGGLFDRIKGATAAYLIANLTGRTFKIEILMEACDFHQYLVPNHVDWYLPSSFHETVKPSDDISTLSKYNDREFLKNVDKDFSSSEGMNHRFVYYRGNAEFFLSFKRLWRYQKQLSWMNNLTYNEIVNTMYRRLFRHSAYMQRKTKAFLEDNLLPQERLVCVHLRTGRNPSNPSDEVMYEITKTGFENTWRFLDEMTRLQDSKVFLMSDSEAAINQAKGMSFGSKVFSSPGKMVHIDRSPGVPASIRCQGLEKIIMEHFVLLHCDILLISLSSIGIHAASVRNTDEGLYCLHKSGQLTACRRDEIIDIYNLRPLM